MNFGNVIFMNLALVSMCLIAWSLHPGDIGARHDVDFGLILTAVAFKLLLAEMLPALPY